jgi:hypothetical protein
MRDAEDDAVVAFDNALGLGASLQRITRAELTLAASRAELELAEERYAAGLADIVELETRSAITRPTMRLIQMRFTVFPLRKPPSTRPLPARFRAPENRR